MKDHEDMSHDHRNSKDQGASVPIERHGNPENEGLRHVTWKFGQVLAQNPLFLTRKQPGASCLGSNDEGGLYYFCKFTQTPSLGKFLSKNTRCPRLEFAGQHTDHTPSHGLALLESCWANRRTNATT